MTNSGMRYQAMLNLVGELGEIKTKISNLMIKIQNERSEEVGSVYGGSAADNFKTNMKTIADAVDESISKIMSQLSDEAERQHDAYLRQEAAMQEKINI